MPRRLRELAYAWHPGRARRWERYPGLQRVPGAQAVLTFDDGPDEDATPAVLDALDAAGVRASFFVLADRLLAHPELGREIQARGHELALHGYGHQRQDRIADALSSEDVIRGFAAIENITGHRCHWYRPPYGKMSDGAARACRDLELTPVYWSAWGLDWEDVDARRITDEVCAQLRHGAIILLHDSARFGRRASAEPTAEAIPLIADEARQRGITWARLDEAYGLVDEVAA